MSQIQTSAERLYPDLGALAGTGYMESMTAETGAVLMGRKGFEMADPDWFVGNYELQVPIFVLPGRWHSLSVRVGPHSSVGDPGSDPFRSSR